MEPITLTAISIFLAPYLKKAGEKVAEKSVETLFNSHKELAEKFKGLFNSELITLGLNDHVSVDEINEKLEAKPEIRKEISKKVESNQDLMKQLTEALSKQEGVRTIINSKNYIENIEHIDTANF